jgi:hypothetical protein
MSRQVPVLLEFLRGQADKWEIYRIQRTPGFYLKGKLRHTVLTRQPAEELRIAGA